MRAWAAFSRDIADRAIGLTRKQKQGRQASRLPSLFTSKNIVRSAPNRQIVPVLVFSCTNKRMNAAIPFNLDGRHIAFTLWKISSGNSPVDYGGNVPVMMRSLLGHHILRMRLVGLTGSSINATFDVGHAKSGTSGVHQTCALAGN